MDINDLRRKLHLGLRSLQLSALTSIKTDATRRPPQHAWDKTSPVSLLWDALLPTDDAPSSPFLAAASGDAVIYLVRKGGLDWQKSLNQVLARLATVSTPALPYVVRVVAQLLILHVESHMKDASAYKSPFGQKTRRPHPLITAVVRRPDAWSDVLFEVQDMFAAATRSNNVTTLRMLDPFIRFACLETAMDPVSGPGQYQAALVDILLSPTTTGPSDDHQTEYSRMLLNLFLSILLSLPVVPGEAMITQTVLCDHIVGLVRKLPDAESHTRAICQLLNWTFDCRQSGRSLSVPLRSLQSYFATCGLRTMDTAMPPIIFAALSYCLLDVAEYPNQGTVLITLMLDIVKLVDVQEAVMQTIAPVAVLPLLQTLSEMTDSPVKRKVFDILVILERAVLRTSSLESDLGKSVRAISDHATGSFAVLVGDLQTLMLSYSLGSPEDGVLKGGDPHRSAFLYAGLIFHSEESTRIRALSACTSVSFPSASGYMSMLPLLLYVLKNDPSPHVQIHVLLKSLPALTAANDAFVTARVMHVVQSLLGDSAGSAGTNTLFCVGIRTLLEIWKRQPRVWPQLKGYLLAWAKRRRHGRPLRFHQGGQWSDEAEMETTVAATMRDVCLVRAADCGQDLLPHLFALLQAPELHTMTTVFALQSVNLCIEANITDPRAAWNVFMQQFVARTGSSPAAPGVLQQLCEFYRLVAVKDDQSELYMTLKSEILVSWLLPLMQHTEQNVREACFRAIAAYPAPDLFPVMSSPRELVTSIAAFTQPSPAAADMLANFVEHECKHMRRAVFKGFAAAAGGRLAEDYVSDESKGLQRVIRDVTAELRGLWEGGRAPAGLRSGLAAFSLMSTPSQDSHEGPSTDAKLPFHRSLTNSLRDFSLADHPTFRLEAVPVWTRFWDSALLAAYRKSRTSDPQSSLQAEGEKEKQQRIQDVEQMLAASVAELMEKRLPESHLPSVSVNIILSLTGLLLAATHLGLTLAHDQTSHVVDVLVQQYAVQVDQSPESFTDNQRSDDVQFAVALALTSLAKALQASDEQRFRKIVEILRNGVVRPHLEGQEWYQFACAYGLATMAYLQNGLLTVRHAIEVCTNGAPWVQRGFASGVASVLRPVKEAAPAGVNDFQEVIAEAQTTLAQYSHQQHPHSEDEVYHAKAESAALVLSAAVAAGWTEDKQSEEVEATLKEIVQVVAGKRDSEALYSHVLMAYTRVVHRRFASSSPGSLFTQLAGILTTASSTSIAASTRIAALLSIPPLLGIDGSDRTGDQLMTRNQPAMRQTLDTLRNLAVAQDPKVARVAGWILGMLVSHLNTDDEGRRDMMGAAGEMVAGKKDPPNYSRLHQSASYLRAVFDCLAEAGGTSLTACGRGNLIEALTKVNVPLPPVDWSPIYQKLSQPQAANESQFAFFRFAANHASSTSAKSLLTIYLSALGHAIKDSSASVALADPTYGIPKLLELGGLSPDDDDTVDKGKVQAHATTAVTSSKVTELFEAAVTRVFTSDNRSAPPDVQRQFAISIVPHLTSADPGSATALRTELLRILAIIAYRSLSSDASGEDTIVTVRALVTCISVDVGAAIEFIGLLHSNTITSPKALWAIGRITELATLHAAERPWLTESLSHLTAPAARGGVASPLLHITRQTLTHSDPTSCMAAMCALLTNVRNTVPATEPRAILQWVVLLLDVIILLCAASASAAADGADTPSAVEWVWNMACAGVVGIGRCPDSVEDGEFENVKCVVVVRDARVGYAAKRGIAVELAALVELPQVDAAMRKQIIKRLIRILECTETTQRQIPLSAATRRIAPAATSAASAVRVQIAASSRNAIREVLLRLRHTVTNDQQVVRDAWAEVWEER